jgi:hypothetical protein
MSKQGRQNLQLLLAVAVAVAVLDLTVGLVVQVVVAPVVRMVREVRVHHRLAVLGQ